jgi:hypothetical protein
MNISRAPLMVETLEKSGFSVERMPMSVMTQKYFLEWIAYLRQVKEGDGDEL